LLVTLTLPLLVIVAPVAIALFSLKFPQYCSDPMAAKPL
jgi:hypothetical protein